MLRFCLKGNLSPEKLLISRLDLLQYAAISFFILFAALSASPLPDDQDGVNFILGIQYYAPLVHQPHFPGYPVYITLCKLSAFFSGSPEKGAIHLSILSGAACIYLLTHLLRARFDRLTSILCGILLALNPVFFEFSHKIFSEIPALALLLLAVTILKNHSTASSKRWFLSLAFMGLLLGVRLSWWPFPFIYTLAGFLLNRATPAISGLILGTLLWLVPQTAITGAEELFRSGTSFTYGHFTQWGGAVGTLAEGRGILFGTRLSEAWGWMSDGPLWGRLPWFLLTVAGAYFFLNGRQTDHFHQAEAILHSRADKLPPRQSIHTDGHSSLFFIALAAYLLWVFLGQNPEKVRHLIPVIPFFIIVAAPAAEKFQKYVWIVIACLTLSLVSSFYERATSIHPSQQFKEWIQRSAFPDATFFCGPTERYFDLYPVRSRVVSVKSMEELLWTVKTTWPVSKRLFLCDDIPGFDGVGKRPVETFFRRKGDPVDLSLKIYELH